MDRVLDRLWIGAAEDFRAPLGALGFVGVLDLRDGAHHVTIRAVGVAVHQLENRDGDPWTVKQINNALDFVAARVRHGRVLILCAAGMSRSVAMTIGYLLRIGFDEVEAFERVRAVRPRIQPVPKMLAAVLGAVRG